MFRSDGEEGWRGLYREMVFGDEGFDYYWCVHCERGYRRGQFRRVEGMQLCPYEGCDGGTVVDGVAWDKIRGEVHPEWPEEPVWGVVYAMYE